MKIGVCGHPDINKSLLSYIQSLKNKACNLPFTFDNDEYDDYYDYYDYYNPRYYDDSAEAMQSSRNSASDDEDLERILREKNLACGYEEFDAEYYAKHRLDKKCIYFYSNIYREDTRRKFETLSDFSTFCDDNDYFMTDRTINEIMKRHTSYCCLDPQDLDMGDKVIVADKSYGGLYYSVCDDDDEFYD